MSVRQTGFFDDMDFADFWRDSGYSANDHVDPAPDDAVVAEAEVEMGPACRPALADARGGGGTENHEHEE